jgi:diacylglycerol kinase (ATP)
MVTKKMDFKKLLRSFGYAFSGILRLVKSEQNARIHLLVTVLVVTTGFVLKLSGSEWCVILILIALVWAAEAFNTVIERLTDHLFHGYHKTARIVKDVSAGAVLICAIIAIVCGLIIFLPKILALLF